MFDLLFDDLHIIIVTHVSLVSRQKTIYNVAFIHFCFGYTISYSKLHRFFFRFGDKLLFLICATEIVLNLSFFKRLHEMAMNALNVNRPEEKCDL